MRISRRNYPDNRDLDKSEADFIQKENESKPKEFLYSTSGVLLLISHTGRGPHRDAATSVRKGKYLAFPANNAPRRLLFPYQLPRGADPEHGEGSGCR